MQPKLQDTASAVAFVQSKMFSNIFAEGMELVEETATYLDGEGREASKALSRADALTYASLSMRLTTRLMQIASWLLVLRAVRENEMTYSDAAQEKYRLGSLERKRETDRLGDDVTTGLPERLRELRDETDLLYERISRIDADIFTEEATPVSERDAVSQLKTLQAAFAKK